MIDETTDQNSQGESLRQKGSGTSGSGKKGSGSAGGIRVSAVAEKEIIANHEYLDAAKAMARVAEFFSEGVARASVNAVVAWDNTKEHAFAIVSQLIKWGQDKGREIAYLMQNLTRENAEILRQRYGLNVTGPS